VECEIADTVITQAIRANNYLRRLYLDEVASRRWHEQFPTLAASPIRSSPHPRRRARGQDAHRAVADVLTRHTIQRHRSGPTKARQPRGRRIPADRHQRTLGTRHRAAAQLQPHPRVLQRALSCGELPKSAKLRSTEVVRDVPRWPTQRSPPSRCVLSSGQ